MVSAATHGGRSAGTDPVRSAIVLFLLFFDPFAEQAEHFFQFLRPLITCAHIVDVTLLFILAEPFPELGRQILRRMHILEILCKNSVKLIIVRLCFDQDASAKIIEAEKR